MDTRVIIYILGKLCICMAGSLLFPLITGVWYGEWSAVAAFAVTLAISLGLGFAGQRWGGETSVTNISIRESVATVFFAWVVSAIICGMPYTLTGFLDPLSAFFESMSGLTTTGATVLTDIEALPRCLLFWRSITHWIGGIGIIVIFVALLPQIAGNAANLYRAEVSGFSNSRITPRIRTTALTLFGIYALITIVLAIILLALGMDVYDAVNHAFSAIATGGFSTYNNSVAHFDSVAIEVALGVFMIIAGGNFGLYYEACKAFRARRVYTTHKLRTLDMDGHLHNIKEKLYGYAMTLEGVVKDLFSDVEFRAYVLLALGITLLITINIVWVNGFSVGEGLRHAFFQTASFCSTTGYVSYNYDEWPTFSKLMLAITYFTGGCAGSTAGGIKICRFVVLLKTVAAELRRTLHPQMLLNVYYCGQRLPMVKITNISRFFFVYVFIIAVLSIVVAATGLPVEEAIFGVCACLSSVGPGFGSLGAVGNYSHVAPIGKLALALAMLLGRLELFTALALLRREFWKKNKRW